MKSPTIATKARRGRKTENNAEIRVRLSAKTKSRAEKFFKRHGLSTSDGVRRLIDSAIADEDPWLAHRMSSHLPNSESMKAIEEALAGEGEAMTPEEFRKFLEEA